MKPLANTIQHFINRLIFALSRFLRANQGAVMVYVAAMLPVLIGGGLIVVDGARLYNLQTLLQKGADSLAIAGGRELDGRAGAIARANLAINQLIQNQHKFGAGGAAQIILDPANPPRFFDSLPANDNQIIDASFETADDTQARFVEVTVLPVQLNTIFPASFLGGGNTATTTATAVAGYNLVACDFTPVFICNPFEQTPISIHDAINDPDIRRRHIELKKKGGGESHYSQGNYGFLQPLDNPGADALRDMIGMSNPPTCFLQNGVTLRPGFVATVRDAMNVRFDLWGGPMNAHINDPNFRPARNVRKGYEGSACNPDLVDTDPYPADPPPNSRKLPRDNCFTAGTCTHMGGRMGNGEWDFNGYWDMNFNGVPKPTDADGNEYDCNGPGGTCINPPSRHDIYRHEIEHNGGALLNHQSAGGEMGTPQCSSSPTSDDPDRRMLFGAILNCVEIGIDGGASGPYPVETFAKFFVTEAMQTGPDDSIWTELVDVFEPGGQGGGAPILRPEVQLYR